MLEGEAVSPSVADELVFEALPEDTKAAVIRLYGGAPGEGSDSLQNLAKAYQEGFDDAVGEMSFVEPSCTPREALRAVTALFNRPREEVARGAVIGVKP